MTNRGLDMKVMTDSRLDLNSSIPATTMSVRILLNCMRENQYPLQLELGRNDPDQPFSRIANRKVADVTDPTNSPPRDDPENWRPDYHLASMHIKLHSHPTLKRDFYPPRALIDYSSIAGKLAVARHPLSAFAFVHDKFSNYEEVTATNTMRIKDEFIVLRFSEVENVAESFFVSIKHPVFHQVIEVLIHIRNPIDSITKLMTFDYTLRKKSHDRFSQYLESGRTVRIKIGKRLEETGMIWLVEISLSKLPEGESKHF